MLTKGAIGNLVNRYKAVLGKCRLINTFGSLAVAAMLVAVPCTAAAAELVSNSSQPTLSPDDYTVSGGDVTLTGQTETVFKSGTITIGAGKTLTLQGAVDDSTLNGTVGYYGNGSINGAAGNLNIVSPGVYAAGIGHGDYTIDVNDLTIDSGNFGIYTATSGHKNITANNVVIKAGGDAIHLQGKNDSNISISANNISVTGGVGVRNSATDTSSDIRLSAVDTLSITATGDHPEAAAVDQIGKNIITLSGRDINITAAGANGEAINTGDGILNLNATETIDVQGSIVSREFEAGFPSDTTAGLIALSSGDLRVKGGTVDGYKGTFEQTGGRTFLNEDTGFFAGDVNLRRGQIVMGDVDVTEVGLTGNEAALVLGSPVALNDTQAVNVGSTSAATAGGAAFASDGMLIADGNVAKPLLTGSGTLTMEEGSQIYIVDAKVGQKYNLTEFADESSLTKATLRTSRLTNATLNPDGSISVGLDARSSMLAGAIPASAMLTMVTQGLNDTESRSAGIRFLSRAAEPEFMPSTSAAVSMVNEVSNAAGTAGVQNTALRLADAGANNVLHHMSLGHYGTARSMRSGSSDFWATPMYGNTYMSGMGGHSGQSVRGNYGGLALGVDTAVGEFWGGQMRAGVAINGGGGKSETKGTVTDTENSYGFGGVHLYGAWQRERVNVVGALGYAFGSHDVKMGLPSSMEMDRAKADLDTHAFTADLRLEYAIPTEYVDILPHIGVRYTHLHSEGYHLKSGGHTLNRVDSDNQDIVQFPVGLSFTKDCNWFGWDFKPIADVSYIPVVGDHKYKSKVRYSGIDAQDGISTRIMDDDSWAGMLGLMAENEEFAFGLHYNIQASSHETDQGVNLTFGWKF